MLHYTKYKDTTIHVNKVRKVYDRIGSIDRASKKFFPNLNRQGAFGCCELRQIVDQMIDVGFAPDDISKPVYFDNRNGRVYDDHETYGTLDCEVFSPAKASYSIFEILSILGFAGEQVLGDFAPEIQESTKDWNKVGF